MVSVSRAGHEDSKPIYDVAKVQEGCDVPQHKIDAGEGRCGCCHTAGYCALFLGSLGRLYCHHYTRVYYLLVHNAQYSYVTCRLSSLFILKLFLNVDSVYLRYRK